MWKIVCASKVFVVFSYVNHFGETHPNLRSAGVLFYIQFLWAHWQIRYDFIFAFCTVVSFLWHCLPSNKLLYIFMIGLYWNKSKKNCEHELWNNVDQKLHFYGYLHVFHDLYSAIASAIIFAKLNVSSTFSLKLISITRLELFFLFVPFNNWRLVFILSKYFKNIFVLICMGFSSRISAHEKLLKF